jgi:DNA gyrase subunit A
MRFREGDELLAMDVVREDTDVFTVTDGGFAKRTSIDEYRVQGRGGLGIKAMKFSEARGSIVGALITGTSDEVFAIKAGGGVTRSAVEGVPRKGRDTMGVKFVALDEGDTVVGIARNAEREIVGDEDEDLPDQPAGEEGTEA